MLERKKRVGEENGRILRNMITLRAKKKKKIPKKIDNICN